MSGTCHWSQEGSLVPPSGAVAPSSIPLFYLIPTSTVTLSPQIVLFLLFTCLSASQEGYVCFLRTETVLLTAVFLEPTIVIVQCLE